jgi:hypothetical protein
MERWLDGRVVEADVGCVPRSLEVLKRGVGGEGV